MDSTSGHRYLEFIGRTIEGAVLLESEKTPRELGHASGRERYRELAPVWWTVEGLGSEYLV
jgi:hypothetical protein